MNLFDLRMAQPMAPITTLSVVPSFVKLLPSALDLLRSPQSLSPALLAVGADGTFQSVFIDDQGPVEFGPIGATALAELNISVTACSVASSGRLVALGTSSGAVSQLFLQHIVTDEEAALIAADNGGIATIFSGNALDPVINLKASALEIPPYPAPAAPKLVGLSEPILGTSYVLMKDPQSMEFPLLSSFATTPRMLQSRMRTPMARRFSPHSFCIYRPYMLLILFLPVQDIR